MTRKEFLLGVIGGAGTLDVGRAKAEGEASKPVVDGRQFAYDHGMATIYHPLVKDPVSFSVIADAHFTLIDERDAVWTEHARRAMRWPGKEANLDAAFASARKHGSELVALVGDMFSFPSLANIEFMTRKMSDSGLDCRYIAGNHDWHFEGVPGTDDEQRTEWIAKRMLGLYRQTDPMAYSVMKHGVRFVFIDDSTYLITRRQVEFMRCELEKGDPTVLFMHIPFYMNPASTVFTLANPKWGAKTDPYWEIERRLKWREEGQTEESFALRKLVFSASNMVAVFAGHEHFLQVACDCGLPQFVVPSNRSSDISMNVRLEPS